ncbi:MAG: hypothetical protein US11_C0001G0012 [Candidatus Roizmanbacteria bacterium GW2011_GWA2_36_23]|uniref:Uncharacterized protein n=1 Tax=Candidatus Roizmanbacteria bacterium GW2011_GWA2_36_23 TaxID=1618480 RepID=A0A0G0E587_9BACT|nr:MAG: hypothetical protein US11_C0001G0012 [Candidatus Roizmanbacteria bacterium GW2011_GWA2_36_23]
MMRKPLQKIPLQYNCPFCKRNIAFSKKTEVFYRSQWINGCFECFSLSISEATITGFQGKTY